MNKVTLFNNAEEILAQVAQRQHKPPAMLEDLLKANRHPAPQKESAPAA